MRYLTQTEMLLVAGGADEVEEVEVIGTPPPPPPSIPDHGIYVPSYGDWSTTQSSTTYSGGGSGSVWWPWGTASAEGNVSGTSGTSYSDYTKDVCGSCHDSYK